MWGCYFSIKMAHMDIRWPKEWKVWIVKYLAALSAYWLPLHTALFRLRFLLSIRNACGSWGFSSAFKGIDKTKPIRRYQRQASVEAWAVSTLYPIKQQGNSPEKILKRTFHPVKMRVRGETLLLPLLVSGRLCVRTESMAAISQRPHWTTKQKDGVGPGPRWHCRFNPRVGKTLEKEMATHASILAWEIPWMEEPGRLQSMGSQRVSEFTFTLQVLRAGAPGYRGSLLVSK